MEKIINSTCNVVIEDSYKLFNEAVYYFNKKQNTNKINIDDRTKLNINDIYDEVLIITDQNVYNHQVDDLINSIKGKLIYEYIVSAGEDSKSLEVYEQIMNYCIKIGLSRKSVIIAVGGGVVGDLGGYIASTYMRGIDVIQVPTSLLAQVDSSIGGKTGINLGKFKNIIGSFYQPKFTYINVNSLRTLPQDEFISGMAEVIKYGVLYDYDFLEYLIENSEAILNRDNKCLYYIVNKCASIKVDIVGQDEKEGGLRKILNFGHTFGHGVEKLCKISHGDAVSIGMNMAFKLAISEKLISQDYYDKYIEVSKAYDLPLQFETPFNEDNFAFENELEINNNDSKEHSLSHNKDILAKEILNIMKIDKKNSFGKINLILPVELGKVEVRNDIDEYKILDIIRECSNA